MWFFEDFSCPVTRDFLPSKPRTRMRNIRDSVLYGTGESAATVVSSTNEARTACYPVYRMWRRWLQHQGRKWSLLQKHQRTTLQRLQRNCYQNCLERMCSMPSNRILPQQRMPELQRCWLLIRLLHGQDNGLKRWPISIRTSRNGPAFSFDDSTCNSGDKGLAVEPHTKHRLLSPDELRCPTMVLDGRSCKAKWRS